MSDRFVYVTYIRTTQERVWDALTKPEFTRAWFWGTALESDWATGSPWRMVFSTGQIDTSGEVLESDRPKRLVLSWKHERLPELAADGVSTATFELEPRGKSVKLTITHEIERDHSKLIEAVGGGWPVVLSSLKTFLETGEPLDDPKKAA